jgi:hypothetical protein
MLAGTKMAAMVSFQSACRFFSAHTWDTDRLGLAVAALIVQRLLPANAALRAPAPPHTGRRGRPGTKGPRLPRLVKPAATATWHTVTAHRYGRTDTVMVAVIDALWYRPFRDTPGRAILFREPDTTTGYDLALFTTDRVNDAEHIVERYADRWSIEPDNAVGKQLLGVGPARNRVPQGGRAHRALRVPHPDPDDRLVRDLRPPRRRPHQPSRRGALVPRRDRASATPRNCTSSYCPTRFTLQPLPGERSPVPLFPVKSPAAQWL